MGDGGSGVSGRRRNTSRSWLPSSQPPRPIGWWSRYSSSSRSHLTPRETVQAWLVSHLGPRSSPGAGPCCRWSGRRGRWLAAPGSADPRSGLGPRSRWRASG
jgi:hypothetical protein